MFILEHETIFFRFVGSDLVVLLLL